MLTRKEMKKKGKATLKKHYLLLVTVCLLAAFIGAEFSGAMTLFNFQSDGYVQGDSGDNVGSSTNKQVGIIDVIDNLYNGNTEDSKKDAEAIKKEEVESTKGSNTFVGRSKGVLAGVVNDFTSGAILVSITAALTNVIGNLDIVLIILSILAISVVFLVWFFIKNTYVVISRRMFLESCNYKRVPIKRFIYLLMFRRWGRVSCAMFRLFIYKLLWTFTIIGIVVKHYSYYMVPYILAENPDIKGKNAIKMSREMMYGHKWECFKFQLSFIGWALLDWMTMGLVGLFFYNPYKVASLCEYYGQIRTLAKEKGITGNEFLNDKYLFEKVDEKLLNGTYGDIIAIEEKKVERPRELCGIRGFIADVLGLVVIHTEGEKEYRKEIREQQAVAAYRKVLAGEMYPERLFTIPEKVKKRKMSFAPYDRYYSVWSMILIFIIFSVIGWIWEVSLHLISSGTFVNRGMLRGPWLPIYGTGGIMILVVLNKFRRKPLVEFVAAVVLCGFVEYFTSLFMEMEYGHRWWNYSGYFLNFNGRICAEGLLVFGIAGMIIVYALAPLMDALLSKIPVKVIIPISLIIFGMFMTDVIYSSGNPNTGKGITSYPTTGAVMQTGKENRTFLYTRGEKV